MDLSWLPATIIALGSLIASVAAAIVSLRTKKTVTETAQRVDGRMEEMLAMYGAQRAAEATLAARDAPPAASAQAVLDRAAERARQILAEAAVEAAKLLAADRKRSK